MCDRTIFTLYLHRLFGSVHFSFAGKKSRFGSARVWQKFPVRSFSASHHDTTYLAEVMFNASANIFERVLFDDTF